MKVNWIVDTQMFETEGNLNDTFPAISENPDVTLFTTRYEPFDDYPNYGSSVFEHQPTIMIGTINYVKKCKRTYTPGAWGFNKNTDCTAWMTYLPNDWLLNGEIGEHFFHTWGYIKEHLDSIGDVFIRPNSGFKTFPGILITSENLHDLMNGSIKFSSIMDETLCLVATPRKIFSEYRFVIGAREVICGSQYRYNDVLDIRRDYPEEAFHLADKVAKYEWQPDLVYTCDVAMTLEGAKIIELNSFACAGLYACDKKKLVAELNKIAIKEWNGDYD